MVAAKNEKVPSSGGRRSARSRKVEDPPEEKGGLAKRGSEELGKVDEENISASSASAGSKRPRKDADKVTSKEGNGEEQAKKSTVRKKAKSQAQDSGDGKKSGPMLVPNKKAKWKEDDLIYGINREDLYLAKVRNIVGLEGSRCVDISSFPSTALNYFSPSSELPSSIATCDSRVLFVRS